MNERTNPKYKALKNLKVGYCCLKDPTELNSHLSTLKCPKCEGYLLMDNPLTDNPSWQCKVTAF